MPRNSPVYARELFAILTPSLPRNPGEVIEHQCSWLTDRASEGPHYKDATFLRVHSERVTVSMAREFELGKLTSLYLRATPRLQRIFRAAIGKQGHKVDNSESVEGCSEEVDSDGVDTEATKTLGRDPINVCIIHYTIMFSVSL